MLDEILKKYGEGISIGLEKEFGFNRYDYFSVAWNIDPKDFIEENPHLRSFLINLNKNFDFVLLSDAPRVWIDAILKHFNITNMFQNNIFSGESDIRKSHNNAFEGICKKINIKLNKCISVGDQEKTDIMPAKILGMTTVYVGEENDTNADYAIKNIFDLEKKLSMF